MDRKLVRSIDATNGDQFNFQPGRVHAILLLFTGTAATGQTPDLSNLGSVTVTRDGRQIDNVKVESIADINDIRFGSNLFSSVEAGAFLASAYIPYFESDADDEAFRNALEITGDSELNFEWVPDAGVGTSFDSLQLAVYAELAAYPEVYEYRLLRNDQSEDGAVAGKPYQLNKNNITAVYLTDPDDVVDLIQLEQNERSVYSPQDWDVLEAGTLLNNKLETSSHDMIELQAYSRGNLASAVNRNSVLSVTTSGAGDIGVVTASIHIWDR